MKWARALSRGLALCGLAALAGCASGGGKTVKTAAQLQPQVCADSSFPIYFETSSVAVSPAALQVIADSAARVRGCEISAVELLGLADATGSARGNLDLSRKRAVSVADALAAQGLPRPAFDIGAAGQSGAVSSGGEPEPLRRRTEVVIRAKPKAP